ncbi:MAG: NAD(P)H-binding protein [Bacteroidetes bacterium]|nr:NAD(P)H-binding protein [Bacteroidota bacterium]
MKFNKVMLYGATGLVGSYVLDELIHSSEIGKVICVGRKAPDLRHPKVISQICEPSDFATWVSREKPEAVFCCLGTTRAKAGSKDAFRLIDKDLPVAIAKKAAENGVSVFAVVSSIGAKAHARNFYLRTKGEMEKEVLGSGVPNIVIVRPSLLLGPRQEFRLGEKFGEWLMKLADRFLTGKYRKYKAIHARSVAVAMLRLALKVQGKIVVESDELTEIAKH